MKIQTLGKLTVSLLLLQAGLAAAVAGSGTWTNDASSVWSGTTNWSNGAVADGTDAIADFSTIDITGDRTVTLDSSRSVGTLQFSDVSGAQNWTLNSSGGSALTLSVSSGSPTIAVTNTATLNVPLAGSAGLTKTGNGTLVLGGTNSYTGATAISAGAVKLPAPSVNASTVPTPLLYMSFDNVTGGTTVVNDGSGGSAMNGTLAGTASIVSGGRNGGNCLSIPATLNAGKVTVNNSVVLFSGSTTWTVAMWIKTTTAGGAYLYQGSLAGSWTSGNTVFHLNNGGNQSGGAAGNGLDGRGSHAGGVAYGRGWQEGSTVVNDGNWHFVVMTCAGNNTKVSYVDGNVDAWSQNNWSGTGVGAAIWIGGSGSDTGDGCAGLNGLIDEVAIYNTTLSQSQVQALMAAGTVPSASAVSVAAGTTLDLNGCSQTVAGLSGSGTVDSTLASGTPMLVVNNSTTTASSFSGVINNTAGSLSLVKAGTNSLTLNSAAANTYTGATIVNGGSLIEDFANATSANNLISSSSPLVLGGGTLQVKQQSGVTTSQTFAGTTVNPGFSKIIGTQVGSGAVNIALGAITQYPGGTVDFTNTSTGSITTTSPNINGILGGWATVGNAVSSATSGDWACTNGSGQIVPYSGYTVVSSGNQAVTNSALNLENTGTIYFFTNSTINSLNMQADVSIYPGSKLTLASGGLMLHGAQKWMTSSTTDTGNNIGTAMLASGLATGELYVHVPNASASDWTIWPIIVDGSVPTTLIKDGPGLVYLNNHDTYTGGTIVNGGTLVLSRIAGNAANNSGGSIGTIRGTVTVNPGATLTLNAIDALGYTAGSCVNTINVIGGTLSSTSGGNEGYLCNINLTGGTVTSSGGNYVFSAQTTPVYGINSLASPITSLFSGPVHFNGLGFFNVAQGTTPGGIDLNVSGVINNSTGISKNGAGTILLSGANTFTGGWINNAGTAVIGNNSAFGTGLLTVNGGAISNNTGTSYIVANNVNLASTASFGVNSGDTLSLSGVITNTGGLTKVGNGSLVLSNANAYTGSTTISGGTLALNGSGTISGTPGITVGSGATFDVSSINFTLGGSQSLLGSGTNNGSINTTTGSKIYAGIDGGYGTNTFKNNLTLASGALCYFDLGTVYNGSNDQIVVNGNLTNNNNTIHIKAPSTLIGLDTNGDYTLFTVAGTISGSFATAPTWDVQPTNFANFSIVTSGNTVTLHYIAATPPSCAGTAGATTLTRNQSTMISVTVTPGSSSIASVTLDASAIGGSSSVPLVQSDIANVYTNTVTVSAGTTTGSKTLTALATDTTTPTPLAGSTNITLTVVAASQVWNGIGTDDNWSSNPNWTSGLAPGYSGDSVVFAGTTRLTPNMDTNYSLTGLVFDSTAGAFTISSAGGNAVTLTGVGVTNNSTSTQTLNVPVTMGAAQIFNAAAGDMAFSSINNGGALLTVQGQSNVVVSGIISGAGGITKQDNGTLTLSGANTYTGTTTVGGGKLNVTSGGIIANTGGGFTVGKTAGVNATLAITGGSVSDSTTTGNAWSAFMEVGLGANFLGTINLSSGSLNAQRHLVLGDTGGYGTMTMSGGTLTVGSYFIQGFGTAGYGVFNQSGGSVTQNQVSGAGSTLIGSGTGAVGLVTLSGGTFNATAGGIFLPENGASTGCLNISGTAAVTAGNVGVRFGNDGSASTGTLNLLGGTLTANTLSRGNTAAGTAYINFNGGTLKAGAANANFITNMTGIYIYPNGGTIDNGGYAITNSQALQAPASLGVSSITVSSGGSGYVNQPLVVISGGTGGGATAVANVSGGVVTGFTITSPGVYTAAPTTVTLYGGGGSGAGSFTINMAANTSGGLTFQGSGTTTLSGASTYTGSTTISNGTLALIGSGSIAGTTNISVAGGATFDVSRLSTAFALGSGKALMGNGGTVAGNADLSAGSLVLNYTNGTPSLNVTNGTLTFVGSALTVNVTGTLPHGIYKVISAKTGGTVTGTALSSATVTGIGSASFLSLSNGDLYLTVNQTPVAGNATYTRNAGVSTYKILISDLLTNVTDADGDTITLVSTGTSTNGILLSTNSGYILYSNTNNVNDQFTYTVTDSYGATATGVVTIIVSSGSSSQNIASEKINGDGTITLNLAGVPGYTYRTQASTNLTDWVDISTNTAGSNGLWQVNDSDATNYPSRYYRTVYP